MRQHRPSWGCCMFAYSPSVLWSAARLSQGSGMPSSHGYWQYWLMPRLAPVMERHTSPKGLAIAHVVFGAALGLMATGCQRSRRIKVPRPFER